MLIFAVAMQVWDVRSLKRTGEIKDAHMMPIRDVDFAHQEQHKVVTGGDDCQVCVWDLRYAPAVVRIMTNNIVTSLGCKTFTDTCDWLWTKQQHAFCID